MPEITDDLIAEAADIVVQTQFGSQSMIQRRLRLRFAQAAAVMDQLHALGIVGPDNGTRAREVLVTLEQLDALRARPPHSTRG